MPNGYGKSAGTIPARQQRGLGYVPARASSAKGGGSSGGGISVTPGPSGGEISLEEIADQRILANYTGSTAVPVPTELSTVLDALSSAQGSILYRGPSAWAALAPGTNGYFLKTQGAGSNPAWAAVPSSGGTVTSIAVTSTSLTVTGSPITTAGTITVDMSGAQVITALGYTPGTGNGTVTSVNLASADGSITPSGGPITTAGSVDVSVVKAPKWTTARTVTFTGDVTGSFNIDGSGNVTCALTFTLTIPSAANPTASVGLSAVNGSAATFMRSDAAPALSQSIAPTWSAAHIFNVNGASATPPVKINGTWFTGGGTTNTKPQLLVEPSGTTSASWSNGGTGIGVNAPSGFGGNLLDLQVAGSFKFRVDQFGDLVAATIDAGGGSPSFRLAPSNTPPAIILRDTAQLAWSSTSTANGSLDTFLTHRGAATVQLGAADAASPVAQTLTAQGSRSGTDTNVGGANLTLQSGRGTGTGAISSLILQSPVAAASGSGAQTQTTGATIKNGVIILPVYTVATLPTASTVTYGKCFVSDATATTFGSTVAGGGSNKVPVWSDGTNWIIG